MSEEANVAWSADDIEQAFDLYRYGYSNRQVADKLGRTINAVQSMFQREYCLRGNSKNLKYTADKLLRKPPLPAETDDFMVRAEGHTAFLIALLRAGHTPGQGEYLMTSEARSVPRHIDVSRYSLVGSQAAMCAGA